MSGRGVSETRKNATQTRCFVRRGETSCGQERTAGRASRGWGSPASRTRRRLWTKGTWRRHTGRQRRRNRRGESRGRSRGRVARIEKGCNTPREKASTPDFRAHLRRYTSSDARAWGAWMAAPWAWGTTSRARTRAARRARGCTARCARRASPPSASTRRRRFQHLGPATEARAWSPPCPPARSASGPPSWRGASWGAAEASPRGARDPIRSVPASPLAPFAHASPANKSENNRWEVAVLSCFCFLARDETGFR